MNDQCNDVKENKLTNVKTITINNNNTSKQQATKNKYVDDNIRSGTVFIFNATVEKYSKVTVIDLVQNHRQKNGGQIIGTTKIKDPKRGGYLLDQWITRCKDKNAAEKLKTLYIQKKQKLLLVF